MCEKVYCLIFSALQFYFVSIPKNLSVNIMIMITVVFSRQLRMPLWYYRKGPIRCHKYISMKKNYADCHV